MCFFTTHSNKPLYSIFDVGSMNGKETGQNRAKLCNNYTLLYLLLTISVITLLKYLRDVYWLYLPTAELRVYPFSESLFFIPDFSKAASLPADLRKQYI